jgi:hypothetical protein
MFIASMSTDIVDAHIDQSPLAGALKNAGFKVGREYFRQQGENLELHARILA